MSKVVVNIWGFQKRMWDHRNIYIHVSNGTIHKHKEEAMYVMIQWEFSVGQNILFVASSILFTGKVQRLLKDDSITKSQWLISIWNARYHVRMTAGLGGW